MTDRVEEIRGRAEKYHQLFKDEDVDVSMRIGDIRYLLDEVDALHKANERILDMYNQHVSQSNIDNAKNASRWSIVHKICTQYGVEREDEDGNRVKGTERVRRLAIRNQPNIKLRQAVEVIERDALDAVERARQLRVAFLPAEGD